MWFLSTIVTLNSANFKGAATTAECFPIGQNNPKSGRKVGKPYHLFPTISFSLRRFFRQHSLNAIYHLRVNLLPRGDHTKIRAERAPKTKVKRTPTVIGDDSASFFDEERPRRMVLWREAVSQVDYFFGQREAFINTPRSFPRTHWLRHLARHPQQVNASRRHLRHHHARARRT